MEVPKIPLNELHRLDAVKSYNILDTLPESDYDNITKLAATICDVPISLITVLDENRNFYKSHYGTSISETSREISFCGHAILHDDILIVNDARSDIRFVDNPLIKDIKAVFYAGVPLINPEGHNLGTICVIDDKPREISSIQIDALKTLSVQVVNLFELRKNNAILQIAKFELEKRNTQLQSFAGHVSHDLKSPLANIISLTELLREELTGKLSEDSSQYLDYIEESTIILKDYIDGILMHYKSDELLESKNENVNIGELSRDIKQILISGTDELKFPKNLIINNVNKAALLQILMNLVDNALKHNDKSKRLVEINYDCDIFNHKFSISDNGIGIPQDKQDYIFEIFKTIKNDYGKSSTGIGLSTVKNLVEKSGGRISVSSEVNVGSTFTFTLPKRAEYINTNASQNCEI